MQVVLGPQADQVAGEMRAALAGAGPAHARPVAALVAALGGAANVKAVEPRASRLLVTIASRDAVDNAALAKLDLRGFALPSPTSVHLLTGPEAEAWAGELELLLAAAAR